MLASGEEFKTNCAYGLAQYDVLVKTDCTVTWKNPTTGKVYCFSSGDSKQKFLKDVETNIAKAEENFTKLQKKQ